MYIFVENYVFMKYVSKIVTFALMLLLAVSCREFHTLTKEGKKPIQGGAYEVLVICNNAEWEREQVRKQIEAGEYSYEDEVEVYSMPRCWRFMPLGKAKVRHTPEEGFVLEGHYRGKNYRIQRTPAQMNSLHTEYDWICVKPEDCFDISTEDDSFYCYPSRKNVITKLALATEEIYKLRANQKTRTE